MTKQQELIRQYARIKDELLEYTEEHHDAMHYDIQGYCESFITCIVIEDVELEELQQKVKGFERLLDAYKNLPDYTYC